MVHVLPRWLDMIMAVDIEGEFLDMVVAAMAQEAMVVAITVEVLVAEDMEVVGVVAMEQVEAMVVVPTLFEEDMVEGEVVVEVSEEVSEEVSGETLVETSEVLVETSEVPVETIEDLVETSEDVVAIIEDLVEGATEDLGDSSEAVAGVAMVVATLDKEEVVVVIKTWLCQCLCIDSFWKKKKSMLCVFP